MSTRIVTESRQLILLAFPLIFNLLGYMAMQLVDTLMLGRLGPLALAAAGLGSVIYVIVLVFCMGILTAVGTLSAQAYGAAEYEKVSHITGQGLWLVLFASIPGTVLLYYAPIFLIKIGQPLSLVVGTKQFLHGLMWGYLPSLGYIALREFVSAISKPKIVMLISVTAIPLNALANYVLMYGKFGFPALKIMGVGLATSLIEWGMVLSLASYITYSVSFRRFKIFTHLAKPDWVTIKKIIKLGLPVGVAFSVEELLFVVTAFLVGYLGVVSLAAHQIAIQCMTMAVMIPIGIAQATAVRVSHEKGANHFSRAILVARLGMIMGVSFAFIAAGCFWFLGKPIVGFFLDVHRQQNQEVVQLAVSLLFITALFHIIDALQIITNGALRGLQDTFIPMLLGVISFWVVGIGSGYYLGFILKWGVRGLWWGLALGMTISAILLQCRFLWQCTRMFKREGKSE